MCLGGGGQACRRSDDPFASAADAQERILSGSSLTLRRQACPAHPSPHPASSATKAGEQHQRFAILRAVDYWIILEDSGCSAVVHSPEFAAEVEGALAGSPSASNQNAT